MADIIHITADIENPTAYLAVRLFAEGTYLLVLRYSITSIIRITAYDNANHSEFFPKPSGTLTAMKADAVICNNMKSRCIKSSVSNLVE